MLRSTLGFWSVLLLLALALPAHGGDNGETARRWLEKMARAAKELNYDATFVYRHGEQLETMRIIHRAGRDGERERLVSLNGAAREVLRDASQVTCILPDRRSVVVERSHGNGILPSMLRRPSRGFAGHYTLALAGGERVAGRETRIISIKPADEFRYGYRLWLDRDTGLLLKSELRDREGTSLEQILFTSLELPEEIPDSLLEPGISGDGFTWHGRESKTTGQVAGKSAPIWQARWLPEGFALTSHGAGPMPSGRMPVEHMLFTDGLASFSIYIEPVGPDRERFTGFSRMGAINAFGAVLDKHQITVVGEVPGITVASVGKSVRRAK